MKPSDVEEYAKERNIPMWSFFKVAYYSEFQRQHPSPERAVAHMKRTGIVPPYIVKYCRFDEK
jgi:hypothetical protein